MQYYGAFCRSALLPLLRLINAYLMRWLRKKYKRLAPNKKARACWERVTAQYPRLFATGPGCPILGGQDDRSCVTRLLRTDLREPGEKIPPGSPT
jgi:Group II intron, maturase-specific domain